MPMTTPFPAWAEGTEAEYPLLVYHDGASLARVSVKEIGVTGEAYWGNGHALVMTHIDGMCPREV